MLRWNLSALEIQNRPAPRQCDLEILKNGRNGFSRLLTWLETLAMFCLSNNSENQNKVKKPTESSGKPGGINGKMFFMAGKQGESKMNNDYQDRSTLKESSHPQDSQRDNVLKNEQDTGLDLVDVMSSMSRTSIEEDERKRENANINSKLPAGKLYKISSEISKEYYIDHYLPKDQAEAHRNGDIHIHDLDFLTECTNCLQMDLGKVLKGGWNTEHGYLREPQRIMSAAALAAISMQAASVNQFGGISHNAFDYALAPYVAKEFRRQYSSSMNDALMMLVTGWDSSHRDALKKFYAETEEKHGLYPQMVMKDEFIERERKFLSHNCDMDAQAMNSIQSKVYEIAYSKTESMTHEAMVSFTSNINTMQSRAAGQPVFASENVGTDISKEGRMITRQLLLAMDEGLGNGETCIFPIVVFKLKSGVSYNPGDPNYDLFKLACRVSAKRLYPNFVNLDAPYNAKYYKAGHPETEMATMGCRTRIISNVYDPDNEVVAGRGNLFFVTINLPRLGILAYYDIDKFYKLLDEKLDLCLRHLLTRFDIIKNLHADEMPFHMLQGGWTKTENMCPDDTIEEALKQGSMSIGFVGLAETLVALIGKHHGESEEAQQLGLEIVRHIRKFTDDMSEKYKLNFSTFATPAESTAGTFLKADRKRFGIIRGVTDKEYYTNSSHVPVNYPISAFDKIRIEAPYHELENAGHISYVEMDGDPLKNLTAFESVVRCFHDYDAGYFSINHPVDQDTCCGYVGIIDDVCPKCGRKEGEPMTEEKAHEIGLLKGNITEEDMQRQQDILRYCCY